MDYLTRFWGDVDIMLATVGQRAFSFKVDYDQSEEPFRIWLYMEDLKTSSSVVWTIGNKEPYQLSRIVMNEHGSHTTHIFDASLKTFYRFLKPAQLGAAYQFVLRVWENG